MIKLSLKLLVLCVLMASPAVLQAQFTFTTNGNAITIAGYTGSDGTVVIPGMINDLPVTRIGDYAFINRGSLTNVTLPDSVTSIGVLAFYNCNNLTNIDLGNGIASIGDIAFENCTSLTAITIPDSVTSIGGDAFMSCSSLMSVTLGNRVPYISDHMFYGCSSLTRIVIPNSATSIEGSAFQYCVSLASVTVGTNVTSIGNGAFYYCTSLTGVFFRGPPPSLGWSVFDFDKAATVYYLPGTTTPAWSSPFGGRPATLWRPQVQTGDGSFGVRTNQFGFNIVWAGGQTLVVDACTNLVDPVWFALQTNILTGDSHYFSDPQWTNYPGR